MFFEFELLIDGVLGCVSRVFREGSFFRCLEGWKRDSYDKRGEYRLF